MLDIWIRNGSVIDGSGVPRRRADVAVQGGRIVEVGVLEGARAATVIDAAGRVVTPGFVDRHSHADRTLPILPTADSLVHQGITTVVGGMCGASLAPLLPETRAEMTARRTFDDAPLPWHEWSTYGSYLDYLRRNGIAINMVPMVGQGTVREAVMGFVSRVPEADELARMQHEVVRALEEGAIGLTTGLIYPPGSYATTEELIAVTRPVGERHGYYFSHIRGEAARLLDAIAEAIRIGRESGAAVEIGHFKAAGQPNWPKAAEGLALIDRAYAEGLDITTDMYPYLAGSSSLVSMLPEWAQDGGKEATLKRLADAETRKRMAADMDKVGFFRGTAWDKVLIAGSPQNRAYEGHTVAELAAAEAQPPHEWIFDALLETELQMTMISEYACEENLVLQLQHPRMMIGTDADGRAPQGILSQGLPHPRNYGTFPRILGRYVREQGILSLEEAIHRMCGLPAAKLRWQDRGLIKRGYAADLVILDPDTVIDRATYQAPHQYPLGIEHVLVNGQLVIRNGEHTGARPGQILGRT